MAIEREVITETTTPVERTTLVSGPSPFGIIGGILVALVLLLLVLWFFGVFSGGPVTVGGGNVNVPVPQVTVTPGK